MSDGSNTRLLPMARAVRRMAVLAGTGALASLFVMHGAPAPANDSTASLDAGGLRLTYNPNIRVASEDLYLSRKEVRVAYRFHNTGDRDISTLVAFPLPVMDIGEAGNYVFEGKDPINVIDFRGDVVGPSGARPIESSVEVKATRFGVDVTDVLKRHGIPLTMRARNGDGKDKLYAKLDNLPDDAKRELDRYGVVDWHTSFGADGKPHANVHWEVHITFYWFQTFPAGQTIEVTHRYHPVPRYFFFSKDDLASAGMRRSYCMDQAFVRSAQTGLRQSRQELLKGYELKYVLTTAGNWLGPIGKFRLVVEKSSPEALVSLCAKGIKRTGPTTFELSQDNYSPGEDLKILFVEPMPKQD
jgi:hypothetical protein